MKPSGFFLNCYTKPCKQKIIGNAPRILHEDTQQLVGFGELGKLFSVNKIKWVVIGFGIYMVTSKLGLLNILFRKDKK
mgnify:FL=1